MEKIIRITDAAERLGVSRSTLYKIVEQGHLPPPIKLIPGGRASGFFESQLSDYISKRKDNK
ncbi:helix-turn-helix transcriptional regulator [Deefgea rivuli]|uniref:helix-turn-helix transcriptional regulator n=1 Tax=Deefgea rivuli TaxID=400948 RepID=UPI00048984E7|nr:helix-turn-helix domain-containing protein [Deefgea rivuli]